jgi:hypothetical protein
MVIRSCYISLGIDSRAAYNICKVAEKPDQSHTPSGLTLRRAASLLFTIEGRTARRASESRLAAAPYLPEKAAEARQRAFLQAFEEGRSLPVQPTIQEIERYHIEWAALAPADVEVSAVLAHLLGEKYHFTAAEVPHLREALGFDQPAVQQAFERLYGQPLSAIYPARLAPGEWLRWRWECLAARLEDLPPFWLAYFLTLAAMIGPAALALPIALAGAGPLAGVAILLVAGLAGLLTILALGEVAVRNGHLRFGPAPGGLGRLAADYLGRGGAIIVNLALFGLTVMLLLACYTGLSTTLARATGLPPLFFAAVLLAVTLYFLGGEPVGPGLAVVLLVGATNLVLLLALAGLALGHPASGLTSSSEGHPFDVSALSLLSGVVLAAYFGHVAVGGVARLALKRDPPGTSGKALLGGLAAAVLTAMLVYCLWVVAVYNALGSENLGSLAHTVGAGTVITPLATRVGMPASLLGSLFVLLALGFGSFQFSLALFSQVSQWLPPRLVSTRRSRFWVGIFPIVVLFNYFIFQLASQRASFSGLFWFAAVALPLVAGIFPMLILAASRRKSDMLPGKGVGWLGTLRRSMGSLPVVWGVCLFYLAGMIIYGILVWENPLEQALILLAALLACGVALFAGRRGAFTPRLVINLSLEKTPGERLSYSVIADGQPLAVQAALQYRFQADEPVISAAEGQVENFTELRRISFTLPAAVPGEIKVWTQQPMPDGSTGALPAWLIIGEKEWDLNKCGGEVITRLAGGVGVVTVLFQ